MHSLPRRIQILTSSTIILLCGSLPALAADPPKTAVLENPLKGTAGTIPELIGRFITILTGISGSIALLMFLYGGFLWLTSAGNEEQVTKGKNVFTWSTIGLVVIFMAYAIVSALFKVVGAQQ